MPSKHCQHSPLKSILILSSHLLLGLSIGLFHSDFRSRAWCTFLFFTMYGFWTNSLFEPTCDIKARIFRSKNSENHLRVTELSLFQTRMNITSGYNMIYTIFLRAILDFDKHCINWSNFIKLLCYNKNLIFQLMHTNFKIVRLLK